ncbi:hypothetical protein, partial [Megasphaera sp.]|uniref:hypothetical protein n=1 Tax=Megasphaera sp. TaxID=2023260 RepID=UPI003AB2746D
LFPFLFLSSLSVTPDTSSKKRTSMKPYSAIQAISENFSLYAKRFYGLPFLAGFISIMYRFFS